MFYHYSRGFGWSEVSHFKTYGMKIVSLEFIYFSIYLCHVFPSQSPFWTRNNHRQFFHLSLFAHWCTQEKSSVAWKCKQRMAQSNLIFPEADDLAFLGYWWVNMAKKLAIYTTRTHVYFRYVRETSPLYLISERKEKGDMS